MKTRRVAKKSTIPNIDDRIKELQEGDRGIRGHQGNQRLRNPPNDRRPAPPRPRMDDAFQPGPPSNNDRNFRYGAGPFGPNFHPNPPQTTGYTPNYYATGNRPINPISEIGRQLGDIVNNLTNFLSQFQELSKFYHQPGYPIRRQPY